MSLAIAADAFLEGLKNPARTTGIPSGLAELDRMTGGFGPGEVITLAARTSVGKTSVLLEFIQSACEHLMATGSDRKVAFISAELALVKLVKRWVAGGLCIPPYRLPAELAKDPEPIKEYLEYIKSWPLEVYDKRGPALEGVKLWLHNTGGGWQPGLGESPWAMIAVDHIGKIEIPGLHDIYPRTSQVADELFKIAGHFQCPVIQAAQVNRNVESRISRDKDGKVDVSMTRPLPSDIEGSGKIEQNSDVCILLWREERYRSMFEQRGEERGPMELNVCKTRDGATGCVRVDFIPELTKLDIPGKALWSPAVAPGTPATLAPVAMAQVQAALSKAKVLPTLEGL